MPKKNKDLVADFFGDSDLDWLEDEEDESGARAGLPVAPPPAPPADAAGKKEAKKKKADDSWGARITEAPPTPPAGSGLASAPTLVFSSIDTLPPAPAPKAEEIAAAGEVPPVATPPAPAADVVARPSEQVTEEIPADELPDAGTRAVAAAEEYAKPDEETDVGLPPFEPATIEVEPTSEESKPEAPAPAPEPAGVLEPAVAFAWPEEDDESVDEAVVSPAGPAPEPTSSEEAAPAEPPPAPAEPPPAQEWWDADDGLPSAATSAAPAAPPPAVESAPEPVVPAISLPAPRFAAYAPAGEEAEWRDLASSIVAEAALDAGQRSELLFEAGMLYRNRLADPNGAETLLRDAVSAGNRSVSVRRVLADLAMGRADWSAAVNELVEASALAEGAEKADLLRDAGLLAWQRKAGPPAVELLERAVEADPEDYCALSLLRDALAEAGRAEARADVLERLAGRSGRGAVAVEALWERGCVLQQLGDDAGARRALQAALDLDPMHTPTLVALEALLAGDDVALAALYAQVGRAGGSEAPWWLLQAARAAARSGGDATPLYAEAAATSDPSAAREHLLWVTRHGDPKAVLAVLRSEAEQRTGRERAVALFRLGWLLERSGDADGAVVAYQDALAADPSAAPASEAVSRILESLGKTEALKARYQESTDPQGLLTLAEAAEASKDWARAATAWQALLTADPENALAADGAFRSLYVGGLASELTAHLVHRADAETNPDARAELLYRAAITAVDGDRSRQRKLLQKVLEALPDHRAALELYGALLAAEGAWEPLTKALKKAAEATAVTSWRADLLYRAAHVLETHLGKESAALACLNEALDAVPDHGPTLQRLRSAAARAKDYPRLLQLYRKAAETSRDANVRVWSRFVAALIAEAAGTDPQEDLHALLQDDPHHSGALAALEGHALSSVDPSALTELYTRVVADAPTVPALLRLADLHRAASDAPKAVAALRRLVGISSSRVGSVLAQSLGEFDLAVHLLKDATDTPSRLERARLLTRKLKRPQEGMAEYLAVLDVDGTNEVAALGAARAAQVAGDSKAMRAANRTLSVAVGKGAAQAAYATWAAQLAAADAADDEAAELYAEALSARKGSTTAFEGRRASLVALADATGLQALYDEYRPTDARGLAEGLEAMGAHAAAVAAWNKALGGRPFVAWYGYLERAASQAEDWRTAYSALDRRGQMAKDEATRAAIEVKKRWVLAEKLADTDEAWELYKGLHEASPDDMDVTEALARIAGKRGETALAVRYLTSLAEGASEPAQAARYRRRIGEAYEAAGQIADARQAYLDALDHVRDDAEALGGLKRLAENQQDWPALVQVLQRETALVTGARQIAVLRDIARVTEERLTDAQVAMDAWRAVLDKKSHDVESLSHLMALAEKLGQWGPFVEAGTTLATISTGAERAALLSRVGVACEEHLDPDDALRHYELAIAEETPDAEAARRLERLYAIRGDWPGVVRTLQIQSDVATEVPVRTGFLIKAAKIENDARHDKEAAAEIYNQVLAIDPLHETALRFQAFHLFEAGRFDEALPVCQRLEPMVEQGLDLEDFDVRMELSQFYFFFAQMLALNDEGAAAIGRYERALELNQNHLASLEAVGPLYYAEKKWADAERVYRRLLELSGGQGDREKLAATYTRLGLVERQLSQQEKAYKRFNKALEIVPNFIEALRGMALVLEDRKDWSQLLSVYNNIIYHATDPEDVVYAYMNKGRILDDAMGRPDKAQQHYEKSVAFVAEQPVAFLRLAELAMRRGDYMEAGNQARRGLAVAEDPSDVRSDLLLCHAASRKFAADIRVAQGELDAALLGDESLRGLLGSDPLGDLPRLREVIKTRLDARLM